MYKVKLALLGYVVLFFTLESFADLEGDFKYVNNSGSITITGYLGGENVYIPNIIAGTTVKAISANAFTNCQTITNVIISGLMSAIGDAAFKNCINLKSISLPNSLSQIAENAFEGCTKLEDIIIGTNTYNYKALNSVNKILNIVLYGSPEFPNYQQQMRRLVKKYHLNSVTLTWQPITEEQICIAVGHYLDNYSLYESAFVLPRSRSILVEESGIVFENDAERQFRNDGVLNIALKRNVTDRSKGVITGTSTVGTYKLRATDIPFLFYAYNKYKQWSLIAANNNLSVGVEKEIAVSEENDQLRAVFKVASTRSGQAHNDFIIYFGKNEFKCDDPDVDGEDLVLKMAEVWQSIFDAVKSYQDDQKLKQEQDRAKVIQQRDQNRAQDVLK